LDNGDILGAAAMQDCKETNILAVTTTVADEAAARQLARLVLERRLAACVQLDGGVTSLYRWQGQLCEEPEIRLVIKTLPACLPALQDLVKEHHPYELPQFLACPMAASEAYARWVAEAVA
jgi:periplasmic divalent cation tolerance protein